MLAEINGEKKKVACGPCIRGHRSSKCDHRDRVLMEVRKPGRPLSSCPHPTGSCSCERVVINYTIPKTSECACPSESAPPVLLTNGTGRIQKPRGRKTTLTSLNPAVLEKAIKATQDAETDSSSHLTRTPTSESNNASLPSSASSTPRLVPLQKDAEALVAEATIPASRPTTSDSQAVSNCCKPKPLPSQAKSCCSNKEAPPPQPAPPRKSCCGGSAPSQTTQPQMSQPAMPPTFPRHMPNFAQYPTQYHQSAFGMAHPGNPFVQAPPPFNFHTPIYNHVASSFHPSMSMPMASMNEHAAHHHPEHNCHCGDSCSCFGCAAHPNNATMIEYVRSMHQFMSTGQFGPVPPPTYDVPSYPHQAGYGAESHLGYNSVPANYLAARHMNFQTSMNNAMNMSHPPMNMSGPWPQPSTPSASEVTTTATSGFFEDANASNNAAPPSTHESSMALKEEQVQSPTFSDSPESKDDNSITLSPSSFFWQEMVLPGCNDATGTCQCGDGCECVGCLTHGGHNGVALEMPESTQPENFSDFDARADVTGRNANPFVELSSAP